MQTVLGASEELKKLYQKKGFQTRVIMGDGQFQPFKIEPAGLGIPHNTTGWDEYVPDTERYCRVLKER